MELFLLPLTTHDGQWQQAQLFHTPNKLSVEDKWGWTREKQELESDLEVVQEWDSKLKLELDWKKKK